MRHGVMMTAGLAYLFVGGASDAYADPQAATCIYRSEQYSEGAAICVRKGVLLSCDASDGRLVWKIKREAGLNDICREAEPPRRTHRARIGHRGARHSVWIRNAPTNAKCFAFNGKTYCE